MGKRGVTLLHRGGRVGDDGGEVVGVYCGDDDGPGGIPAPPGERGREPLFFFFFLDLPPSISSGPLSRNPLYPLLEHGALCFILVSNDVLPSYDV